MVFFFFFFFLGCVVVHENAAVFSFRFNDAKFSAKLELRERKRKMMLFLAVLRENEPAGLVKFYTTVRGEYNYGIVLAFSLMFQLSLGGKGYSHLQFYAE